MGVGLLGQILPRDSALEDYEVEHDFPHIGPRVLVLNARRLRHHTDKESILLAFEDRTEVTGTHRERERLLAMEQRARERAEDSDRTKDAFMATVSHELRGPLSSIAGWIHVLRAVEFDHPVLQRGIAAIDRGVKAQSGLIADLLDYSRMVAGKVSLVRRLIDLVPVAETAILALRSTAEAKGVGLALATEGPTAMMHGDADRLHQVLWNLISNAIKFTARGGRVDVWAGRLGTHLHLRVSDTGEGIAPDVLPHVFERFRQADSTSRRKQGGLGLGLAIVKELVELHGGVVAAQSPGQGEGAIFTVMLPVPPLLAEPKDSEVEAEPSVAHAVSGEIEPGALDGLRLLIVEDDADSREALVALLQHYGADVSAAATTGQAMEAWYRAIPDVLISDIGLPGEDGHDLMRRVRSLEGDGRVPALALTAYSTPEDVRSVLASGFDHYLAKPATPAELVNQVARLAATARGAGG